MTLKLALALLGLTLVCVSGKGIFPGHLDSDSDETGCGGSGHCPREPKCECPATDGPTPYRFGAESPNCKDYFECKNGKAVCKRCPDGEKFNTETNKCGCPSKAKKCPVKTCPAPPVDPCKPVCPEGAAVYIPDPANCAKYYYCSGGGAEPELRECCDPETAFDPSYQICVPDFLANCNPTPGCTDSKPSTCPPPVDPACLPACPPGQDNFNVRDPTNCHNFYTCTTDGNPPTLRGCCNDDVYYPGYGCFPFGTVECTTTPGCTPKPSAGCPAKLAGIEHAVQNRTAPSMF